MHAGRRILKGYLFGVIGLQVAQRMVDQVRMPGAILNEQLVHQRTDRLGHPQAQPFHGIILRFRLPELLPVQ